MASRILVIDHEEKFLRTLARRLEMAGFPVQVAPDGSEALNLIEGANVDVLIFGAPEDGANFLALLGEIKKMSPDVAIIMLTPHVSSDYAIKAMKLGIYDCLPKPTNIGELIERINEAAAGAAL